MARYPPTISLGRQQTGGRPEAYTPPSTFYGKRPALREWRVTLGVSHAYQKRTVVDRAVGTLNTAEANY